MMNKKCGTCGLCSDGVCRLYKMKVDTEKDYCPRHTEFVRFCEVCGQVILDASSSYLVLINDKYHQMCNDCRLQLDTCATCKNSKVCALAQYKGPIPKTIQKQVQKGPMVMITEVINPDLVKEVCVNCACYNKEEGVCSRGENNTCPLYKGVIE